MALLDLLHVQRAGFFQFLKLGIDKELFQLNLNVENISLQVIPFFNDFSACGAGSKISTHRTYDVVDLTKPLREDKRKVCVYRTQRNAKGKSRSQRTAHMGIASLCVPYLGSKKMQLLITNQRFLKPSYSFSATSEARRSAQIKDLSLKAELQHLAIKYSQARVTKHPTLCQKKLIKKLTNLLDAKQSKKLSATTESSTTFGRATESLPLFSETGSEIRHYERNSAYRTRGEKRSTLPLAESNVFKDVSNNYQVCATTGGTTAKNQNSCFRLIASRYTPREAILYQKSWSCKLVVKVLLTVHEKRVSSKENLAKLLASHNSDKSKIAVRTVTKGSSVGRKTTDRSRNNTGLGFSQKQFLDIKNSTSEPYLGSIEDKLPTPKGKLPQACLPPIKPRLKLLPSVVARVAHQRLRLALHPRASLRAKLETTLGQSVESKPQIVQKLPTVNHELFLVLGELPLMTKRGHFIIHGSPRVILSQLIRKPGIYFTQKNNELQADCIPEQGPWFCIYKNLRDESTTTIEAGFGVPQNQETQASHARRTAPKVSTATSGRASLPLLSATTASEAHLKNQEVWDYERNSSKRSNLPSLSAMRTARIEDSNSVRLSALQDLPVTSFARTQASYFCYTKQFSSIPFSLVYSTFRVFELHSQFTDQTLLLTKLKTLEKIRRFKDVITTLLTFTWKKRIRKRLQRLYTKQCFTSTQQFEKTKVLFRLKKKLVLGASSRKSFNEKLGISSCVDIGTTQNIFDNNFFDTSFNESLIHLSSATFGRSATESQPMFYADLRDRRLAQPQPFDWPASLPPLLATTTTGEARLGLRPCLPQIVNQEARRATFSRSKISTAPKVSTAPEIKLNSSRSEARLPAVRYAEATSRGEIRVAESENKTLLSRDLALIVSFLNGSKILQSDDIDDLNNQRIRTPSDQVQQQVRIGLFRFKKMLAKLISSGGTSQTLTDFLNGALREFFGSNPLSQFLDQTNPLAEITHKRRVSKLGTGGIQRESATLKVRTIHSTYFGRICPIETPEGVNAGLVNSLTCLSRVDQRGQLITPLSLLIEGQKQEQFFYYSNKENSALSTTDTALLKFHRLPNQFIYTKNESQFQQIEPNKVKLRVKSDLQTISLATALIPFLAYDDANRALMGSNMQRQAVPLILPERPIVRTGMESLVINESGHSFESSSGGFISYISAQYVIILCNTLNKRLLI